MLRIVPHVFKAAVLWIVLLNTASPMQEENQREQDTPEIQIPKENEAVNTKDQKQKERDVSIGFSLLFLIGMTAVTLAVMVVLWGFHMRRVARKRVSRPTREDPLWFLKPKKRRAASQRSDSEASNPESSQDEA